MKFTATFIASAFAALASCISAGYIPVTELNSAVPQETLNFEWTHRSSVHIKKPDGTEPYKVMINNRLFNMIDINVTHADTGSTFFYVEGPFAPFNFGPRFDVQVPSDENGKLKTIAQVEGNFFSIWNREDINSKSKEFPNYNVQCGLNSYTCNIIDKESDKPVAIIRSSAPLKYELVYQPSLVDTKLVIASGLLRTYMWNKNIAEPSKFAWT